ncbi:MAG: FG-GAP-like repeat-containing protein [Acidimicrobiia bacterium]
MAVVCAVVSTFVVGLLPVAAAPGDGQAPTWPTDAEITIGAVSSTTAEVSWTAATDNEAVTGYRIYLNGSPVGTSSDRFHTLTGLSADTGYTVRVEAYDADGYESAASGGLTLAARTDISMGSHPHSVKAEDVNGDSVPDLVVAAASEDGVTIRLGNGDGTFGSRSTYRSGTDVGQDQVYSKNAVLAYLDADSDVDLVVANQNNSSVGVLIGNGDGTFQSVVQYDTCSGAHDVAVGDFTSGSDRDLIVSCHGDPEVTLLEGDGTGAFNAGVDIATGAPDPCSEVLEGNCDHGVVVGNFNQAGDDDIAIAMYRPTVATVMLNTGNGTFSTPANYTAGGHTHDIAAGDFNEDGWLDLVTADESNDTVSVFLNDGDGTFTEIGQSPLPAENGPKGVTVGYLDDDDDLDIAVGTDGGNYPSEPPGNAGDRVAVMLGNGDGTFGSTLTYGSYTAFEGESVFDVDIADVDGDGRGDLLAANWYGDSVSIWFGADAGGPSESFTTSSGANDPPTATGDGPYLVAHGGTVNVSSPGVLGNDSDDGGSMTAVKASDPAHGSVTLNANGSFSYTHSGDEATTDSFTYRARDPQAQTSNLATVTFSISPPPVEGHRTGLVDPTQGRWYLYDGSGSLTTDFYFGNPGDYPFMGDWNCDGTETPGMYRQSDGYVYLRDTNTAGPGDIRFFFGNPGDVPVAGDFNNNGCDTVSIYRPSNQTFYIINELGGDDGGLGAADTSYVFGNPGDKPFVGDFDGDGVETVGLHRETTGLVYFRNSHTQGVADNQFIFGDPGDRLIAGDWNEDGKFSPAIFRPSQATTYFRYTNTQGTADNFFAPDSAVSTWLPVSGDF